MHMHKALLPRSPVAYANTWVTWIPLYVSVIQLVNTSYTIMYNGLEGAQNTSR